MDHSALQTAGPFAAHIAQLFWVFVAIAVLVYSVTLGFFVYALRRRKRVAADEPPGRDTPRTDTPRIAIRAIAASVGVTVVILVVLAVSDFMANRANARAPADAMHVRVTAHQWWWEVEYLDAEPAQRIRTANELHIPVGRPVMLELRSDDVIHSFWVPSLQGKKDLLPGYTTTTHFMASRAGVYRGECAEFCGFQHAHMSLAVHAEDSAQFAGWEAAQRQSARAPTDPQQTRGHDVFAGSTCPQCHTVQGTDAGARLGPDLTHVASRAEIAAGTLPNNPANLAAWITNPQAVKPGTRMPATQLPGEDTAALVAYLSSLQ
jgi:cytochrome c oxidase subunit 2